jgi:hypothetical protein
MPLLGFRDLQESYRDGLEVYGITVTMSAAVPGAYERVGFVAYYIVKGHRIDEKNTERKSYLIL